MTPPPKPDISAAAVGTSDDAAIDAALDAWAVGWRNWPDWSAVRDRMRRAIAAYQAASAAPDGTAALRVALREARPIIAELWGTKANPTLVAKIDAALSSPAPSPWQGIETRDRIKEEVRMAIMDQYGAGSGTAMRLCTIVEKAIDAALPPPPDLTEKER